MCFDDVKLVQMVRFKSRSKLLNGHIVVNDFGAFLLCVETDAHFADYFTSMRYVRTVSAYSRWHRCQGFDSPSRFLQKATLTGDITTSAVPSPTSFVLSKVSDGSVDASPADSKGSAASTQGDEHRSVSFSAAASASQFYYAAEVVASVPAVASLKANEATPDGMEGVHVKQFVRVEGLRDYYLLEDQDGLCRKVALKGSAAAWRVVRALIADYNAWHVTEYQSLPEDFVCLCVSNSDDDKLSDVVDEDSDFGIESSEDDCLERALQICKRSGHKVFDRIRASACWPASFGF